MKKSKAKYATLAGVVLSAGILLSACGNSSTGSKTYNYVYSSDPSSLNYLAENRSTTTDIVTNLVDGLMENDQYGNYVPSLAEDWSVSKDGLTYTYKLRKDAKWYTADGDEYAPVTAQDFVTGLKYAADKKSEALYLVQESVAGLDDYITGKTLSIDKFDWQACSCVFGSFPTIVDSETFSHVSRITRVVGTITALQHIHISLMIHNKSLRVQAYKSHHHCEQ